MRRAAKVDDNQPEIVKALRKAGATVTPTHAAGDGFPDLAVGYRGFNYFLEVKDGNKPPSARKLTKDQVEWHDKWRGQVAVVKSVDEALEVLGIELRGSVHAGDWQHVADLARKIVEGQK
ncbi:hypothetical protein [Ruegeria jejuensis]|uniref:hypothetical protein n=1 Tax=Ruegeria jejuensis TaxID=3233338 RepID=UPI00355B4997